MVWFGKNARSAWLSPALGAAVALAGYNWHIDPDISSSGDGTSQETAFKTWAEAVAVMSSGDKIAVYSSTLVGESPDMQVFDNFEIDFVDSGNQGGISGDRVAANASFALEGGTSQTYKFTFTPTTDGTESYISVWEDDVPLIRIAFDTDLATTLAAVDATAGSYYVPHMDGLGNPYDVYVHASDGSNITSNGKTYNVTDRVYGLRVGDNVKIRGLTFQRCAIKNGAFIAGDNVLCEQGCLFKDGVVHNALAASGTVQDCYIINTDRSDVINGQNAFQWYRADGRGYSFTFQRNTCKNIWDVASHDVNTLDTHAMHAHTTNDTQPYDSCDVNNNRIVHFGGSIGMANVASPSVTYNAIYQCFGGISGPGNGVTGAGAATLSYNRVYGHRTDYEIQRAFQNWPSGTVAEGNIFVGQNSSGGLCYCQYNTTLNNNYIALLNYSSGNRTGINAIGTAAITLSQNLIGGWVIAIDTATTASIASSDYNNYDNAGIDFYIRPTYHGTLAAFQSGESQDANSITDALQVTDSGGDQEPIFTQNAAATSAVNGWSPPFASFDFDLDKDAIDTEVAAL